LFYRNFCYYHTFKKISDNFKQEYDWEKDLQIYLVSMPKFFISTKKKSKCILLIGGYKDIPYVWNEFEKYLIEDKIDYYAPRTFGNGRSFYQIVDWKDWVITYLEAIYILQEQYETIDIIGFSTGAVISVYLSQFKYKCKINNLFLCAPFLTNKKFMIIDIIFGSNIFSKIINRLYVWTFRFRPKSRRFKGYRDTYNNFYSMNDFYEMFGDVQMETVLFDFIKFRPKSLYVENVIIIYPNDDDIIGDIQEQKQIISNVYTTKPIDVISIPSYLDNPNTQINNICYNNLSKKSGHLMFKEKDEIVKDLYLNIKKYF
jgi:esterase/lipase